jgi:hypothetical protein
MPYIGTMKWNLSHLEVLPRVIGLLCQLAFPLTILSGFWINLEVWMIYLFPLVLKLII